MTHRHRWRRPRPSISNRRLYRDPDRGRIAGVCAGLADHFRIGATMMRFVAVTALIFVPQVTLIVYLLAALILPTRAELAAWDREEPEEDPTLRRERERQRAFDSRLGDPPGVQTLDERRRIVRQARERLARIDARVRDIEAYVTSRRYELDREFGKL